MSARNRLLLNSTPPGAASTRAGDDASVRWLSAELQINPLKPSAVFGAGEESPMGHYVFEAAPSVSSAAPATSPQQQRGGVGGGAGGGGASAGPGDAGGGASGGGTTRS